MGGNARLTRALATSTGRLSNPHADATKTPFALASSSYSNSIASMNSGSPQMSRYEHPSWMHAETTWRPWKRNGPTALMQTLACLAIRRSDSRSDVSASMSPIWEVSPAIRTFRAWSASRRRAAIATVPPSFPTNPLRRSSWNILDPVYPTTRRTVCVRRKYVSEWNGIHS